MTTEIKNKVLSTETINGFLKEVQHGSLLDVNTLVRKYGLKSFPSFEDLLVCSNRHGDTPLLLAARHGHTDILRTIHEDFSVSLDRCNMDGKRALHEAAQNGRTECVQYLIEAGSSIDPLKKADWTPLMLACTKDCLCTVRTLVNCGASLLLRNKDGWNPFHIACREGHAAIVSFLLDSLPDREHWDTVSKNGRNPLHTAALHGRADIVRILRDRCGYEVDQRDSCGVTALMDSARSNNPQTASFLLESCGAHVELADSLGRQAIHHAAQAGATHTLQCLVEHGADVNKRASINDITPLHYAAKEAQSEAVLQLLKLEADPSIRDKRGRTALDLAKTARKGSKTVSMLETFYQEHIRTNSHINL